MFKTFLFYVLEPWNFSMLEYLRKNIHNKIFVPKRHLVAPPWYKMFAELQNQIFPWPLQLETWNFVCG
jgi:hypothetical protein